MPTNVRDPRSIITPDAFEIDPALLGTPLARPRQRLVAILIDLAVIGVLTAVTSGLGVFIWGVVGVVLLQMAIRRPPNRLGQMTSVLYRGSIGCLGGTILIIVALVGVANMISRNPDASRAVGSAFSEMVATGLGSMEQLAPAADLRNAGTLEEAEAAALAFLGAVADLDPDLLDDASGMAAALELFMADDPPYTDDSEAFAERMVERFGAGEAGQGIAAAPAPEDLAALDSLDPPAALARYQQGVAEGRAAETDPALARLRARLLDVVAVDTLARLETALREEERRRERTESTLDEVRGQLEEQRSGVVELLRDIWDQAGSAVGLWSLYFTVTLTLFKGYTVGKRIMGIRVVRLDGEPFTWWTSFERGGGYVAGIATGFLGFAQVFWDSNRQCVHDKIVGTAVVVAGAAPVAGAVESAWSEARSPDN